MEREFWLERWAAGNTPFHKDEVNRALREHVGRLRLSRGARLLVPLCGKSLDMHWLASAGYEVLGVELSEVAAEALFAEAGQRFEVGAAGRFRSFSAGAVRILVGDFFDLTPAQAAGVRAVYDRAALIALPREMRRRYARHLLSLLDASTPILLLTLEYAEHEMNGPPFSVAAEEVEALFASARRTTLLEEREALSESTNLRERGLTALTEKVYLLA